MSPVPVLPLILTHKLSVSHSSPGRAPAPYTPAARNTEGDTHFSSPLPVFPKDPLPFHSHTPVIMMARRSQPYRHAHLSNSSCIFPMLCVLAHRHLSWAPNEADLLAGVSGIPSCCPSGTLLLTCNPSPGSGHLLVAPASNWWEWDEPRFPFPSNLIYSPCWQAYDV